MDLSVAIVTPQPHISYALQRILSEIPNLAAHIVTPEPDMAIRQIVNADIVLLHHELTDGLILRLLRTLLLAPGTTLPVIVAARDDPDVLVQYLEHGAVGYVLAGEPDERLREVVTGVAAGKAFVDPRIATRLIERYRDLRRQSRRHHPAEPEGRGRQGDGDEVV